jgi:RNA polymerase sigma-70 factor (ECF subfamily)
LNRSRGNGVKEMSAERGELLRRAREGDVDAFARLFEGLRPAVTGVAARLVPPDDVDDVVMETYLKAWQALPRFRGRASLKTWLYRIAHNCSMDTLRRVARRKEDPWPEAEGANVRPPGVADSCSPAADESAMRTETVAGVREALAQLPEAHRRTLLLRFADELTCAEIAAATGVSLGTVLSRIFYAKRKLRRILQRHDLRA